MVKKESTKAESGNEGRNGRQERITVLATRLDKLFEQANKLPEKDSTKKSMLVRVDDLSNRVEFWQNYLESIQEELKTWDEEVDRIEIQLSGLEEALAAKSEEHHQQAWHEMNNLFRKIDAKSLAMKHIQNCEYKLVGYYSEDDRFYEEIRFNYALDVELKNFSIGEACHDGSRWMKLKYTLNVDKLASGVHLDEDDDDQIGEFSLVFDPNLNFVDEYWFIDVDSPFIIAKRGKE